MKRLALALVCLSPLTLHSQSVTATQLDSIIRKTVAEKHIVGLSVGVMQNGKVVIVWPPEKATGKLQWPSPSWQ